MHVKGVLTLGELFICEDVNYLSTVIQTRGKTVAEFKSHNACDSWHTLICWAGSALAEPLAQDVTYFCSETRHSFSPSPKQNSHSVLYSLEHSGPNVSGNVQRY